VLFNQLGLSADILRAVDEKGYTVPTPIQEQAIPVVLDGRDLLAGAQTGTGKTAAFTLPLLHRLQHGTVNRRRIRALVLVPTRELGAQVGESIRTYGRSLPFRSGVIYGGVSIRTPGLRKQLYGRQVVFHLAETAETHQSVVADLPFIKQAKAVDNKLVIALDDPESHNPEIIRLLVQAGAHIQFVGELRHSLEDVYLQLIKDEDDGQS
jgi:hypothetical protein